MGVVASCWYLSLFFSRNVFILHVFVFLFIFTSRFNLWKFSTKTPWFSVFFILINYVQHGCHVYQVNLGGYRLTRVFKAHRFTWNKEPCRGNRSWIGQENIRLSTHNKIDFRESSSFCASEYQMYADIFLRWPFLWSYEEEY